MQDVCKAECSDGNTHRRLLVISEAGIADAPIAADTYSIVAPSVRKIGSRNSETKSKLHFKHLLIAISLANPILKIVA